MEKLRQYLNRILTKEEIRSIVFLEVILGITTSVISFLIFLFITNAVLHKQTVSLDNTISNYVFSFRQAWLSQIMLIISLFGNQILIIASIAVIIFLTKRKHKKETFIFTVLLLMGVIVTETLKLVYKIPRPNISALVSENSYSYPSGHSLNSFLFYATISYFIFHLTRNRKAGILISSASVLAIFLIGLSRIYLGVHHPSDVFAGYIAGFWLFVTIILIDKTIIFFRLIRESSKQNQIR